MLPRLRCLIIVAPTIGLLAGCVEGPDETTPPPSTMLLVEGATIISPERPAPLREAHVLIRDGRIVSVTKRAPEVPEETARVDGRGRFLVPGLIDTHAHICIVPGLGYGGYGPIGDHPDLAEDYFAQQPRSFLYFGVTTLLDPVPFSPAAVQAFQEAPDHPDLFYCGAAPVAEGYPMVFQDPQTRYALFPYFIYDPRRAEMIPPEYDPSEHAPSAVVRRMRAEGALCVKLFIEDGYGSATGWPIPTDEMIREVRETAHELGMPVLMHANALDMQQIALSNRADILAHGLWNWDPFDGEDGLPESVRSHLDAVIASDISFQPTMRVMEGIRGLFDPAVLEDPTVLKVIPAGLAAWLRTEEAGWFREELRRDDFDGLPDESIRPIMGRAITQGERVVAYLAEHQKPLLLGSDFPASPTYANLPGYCTYQEMQHMAHAGVPLRAILEAATINNARALGLESDYGTIEPGKIANLLLLEANPLDSVDAYDRIDRVILRGRTIDRESLAAPGRRVH